MTTTTLPIPTSTEPAAMWLRCSRCGGITAATHATAAGKPDGCTCCGHCTAIPVPVGIDPRNHHSPSVHSGFPT